MGPATSSKVPRNSQSENDEHTRLLPDHSRLRYLEENVPTTKEEKPSWARFLRVWVLANIFSMITGAVLIAAVIAAIFMYYRGKYKLSILHKVLEFSD